MPFAAIAGYDRDCPVRPGQDESPGGTAAVLGFEVNPVVWRQTLDRIRFKMTDPHFAITAK